MVWHTLSVERALEEQKSSVGAGLTSADINLRRSTQGWNELDSPDRKSAWRILLHQFLNLMVLILIGAAAISAFLGEKEDIIVIGAIVVINALMGFVQEYRAEQAMEKLRDMASPHARVRRDARVMEIPSRELVEGDILMLEAGNLLPADARLLKSASVLADESALTGESLPVEKDAGLILAPETPLADRRNLLFKGTHMTAGRAEALVVATGMRTELGRIAHLLKSEIQPDTPLQKRLSDFTTRIAWVVLLLCVLIFGIALFKGDGLLPSFLTAVSLAVAAIPEALPIVVTITLAMGARSMGRQNALIRRLPAVETLGSVTDICSDKTGTLTRNRMRVRGFAIGGRIVQQVPAPGARTSDWELALKILALSNDITFARDGSLQGEATELALCEAALEAGFDKRELERDHARLAEIPFSSERQRMATLHARPEHSILKVKGAPESILNLCAPLDPASGWTRQRVEECVQELARAGMRVLALAAREVSPDDHPDLDDINHLERELRFVGLVGLMDPPRPEAARAIQQCQEAGIRVRMITGDHPGTALAVARELGLVGADSQGVSLSGTEMALMSDQELTPRLESVRVFARMTPEQKIRIVKLLQARGDIVAMTGDGVNDAPSLKRADVGISMGKGGTDVAREASHLVLLDDHFETIVTAIREGRRIYSNLRKFIRFALTGNSAEILTVLLAPLFLLPTPLLPIHILWVNLVTDGLPGIALTSERENPNTLKQPPRDPGEGLFARGLGKHIVWAGSLIALLTLTTGGWAYHSGSPAWQSMAFATLTFTQLAHVLAVRSETRSLRALGLFSNVPLLLTVVGTLGLQLLTLYWAPLSRVLKTQPLSALELAVACGASIAVFIAVEIEKKLSSRRR